MICSLASLKNVVQERDARWRGVSCREIRGKMGSIAMIVTQGRNNLTELDRERRRRENGLEKGGESHCDYLPLPSYGELNGLINTLAEARLILVETPPLWRLPRDSIVRGGGGQNTNSVVGGSNNQLDATLFLRDDASGGAGGVWPLLKLNMDDMEVRSALKTSKHKELCEVAIKKRNLF